MALRVRGGCEGGEGGRDGEDRGGRGREPAGPRAAGGIMGRRNSRRGWQRDAAQGLPSERGGGGGRGLQGCDVDLLERGRYLPAGDISVAQCADAALLHGRVPCLKQQSIQLLRGNRGQAAGQRSERGRGPSWDDAAASAHEGIIQYIVFVR